MPNSRREFIRNSVLASGAISLHVADKPEGNNLIEGDRLVLLGTQGGPFIRSYQQTPAANLVMYKNIPIVVDTGYGTTFKLRDAGINPAAVKFIFITHHHSDHNLDLGPLLYNAWISGLATPIQVYAPVGLKSLLEHYWESNRFDIDTRIRDEVRPDIRKLVTAVEYTDTDVVNTADFKVAFLKNIHPPIGNSFAIRFTLGSKIVVFFGDTAYCPALVEFARGADYLVHEVMYRPGVEDMMKRRPNADRLKESILSHHTSTEEVGRIATAAEVKNLVLNHFIPADDKALTEKFWMDAVRPGFAGNIIVGRDLLSIAL